MLFKGVTKYLILKLTQFSGCSMIWKREKINIQFVINKTFVLLLHFQESYNSTSIMLHNKMIYEPFVEISFAFDICRDFLMIFFISNCNCANGN